VADIQGTCAERFEPVRDALAKNIDAGLDVGACAAVVIDGELVADVWGGVIDEAGTPWQRDTLINVWSTTKTMTALSALILADQGELDLHSPVARYWPEFAAEGKEGVLVRHLLGHTAGLSGWQEPMKPDDLYDWEKATSLLAAQAPWWEPGTASGYHAITQGYLVGEVVRRISGVSLGTFFARELAEPLGADFHIGTGPEHDPRIALVIPPPPLDVQGLLDADPDSIAVRTLANPPLDAAQSWELPWRRAEIPAAGGHGNARSVATVQSVLACGGEVGGTRFLSEAGCDVVFEEQSRGTDLVLGVPLRLGIGYGINGPELPLGPGTRVCFWGGWGGSVILIDRDARMTIAFVMNRMGEGTLGDDRAIGIIAAAYGALAAS
jgi:CubicO group peptidase (beta-lactamase class C family)